MLLNRELLNKYFNELAELYKKGNHNHFQFEIVIVGGGAVVEAYNFRLTTSVLDADGDLFRECIKKVATKFNLQKEWLNNDFRRTPSYSEKIFQYSKPYRTFLGVLNVRIITREYLIAMKLKSFRQYKNDISDILGVLIEESRHKSITLNDIKTAVSNLYGSYDSLKDEAKEFIENALSKKVSELNEIYQHVLKKEKQTHDQLVAIENKEENLLNEKNIDSVTKKIQNQQSAKEIIAQLKKHKKTNSDKLENEEDAI